MPCSGYRDTLTEAGGVELGVSSVADGQYLRRVGNEIVGAAVSGSSIPPGTMTMWAGNSATPPSGWLLCDGTAIDPAVYPALAAVITTTFNTGGEPPGFVRVPDMRTRFPYGGANDSDRGVAGGSTNHSHSNLAAVTGVTGTIVNNANRGVAGANNTAAAQAVAIADPGHTHPMTSVMHMPPYLGLHYIVKT